jgi:hypothetical protein
MVTGTLHAQNIEYGAKNWIELNSFYTLNPDKTCGEGSTVFIEKSSVAGSVEVKFDFCGYYEQEATAGGADFTQLSVPLIGAAGDAGTPALPFKGIYIEIPEGSEPELSIIDYATENHDLANPIIPVQPDVAETAPRPPFTFDDAAYSDNSFIPASPVQIMEVGHMRNKRVAFVQIYPFKYNPVTGENVVYTNLTFSLDIQESSHAESPRTSDGADYLIIADKNIYNNCTDTAGVNYLEKLKAWKTQKGFITKIVTTDMVSYVDSNGVTKTFNDNPADLMTNAGSNVTILKEFLQNYYNNKSPQISYLLLVGDYPYIPSKFIQNPAGESYFTDYEFSQLAGTDPWNDISIGRLSVDDGAHCKSTVNKILKYDSDPDSGNWYNNSLLMSYFQEDVKIHFDPSSKWDCKDDSYCNLDTTIDDGYTCTEVGIQYVGIKSRCVKKCDPEKANSCDTAKGNYDCQNNYHAGNICYEMPTCKPSRP